MPTTKLTDLAVRRLKAPAAGRVEYFDATLPGFGIRITAADARSWVLLYRAGSAKRRMTLGRYPAMSLAEAREAAGKALDKVDRGQDPAATPLEERPTTPSVPFEIAAEQFLSRYVDRRHKHPARTRHMVERYVLPEWRGRRLDSIKRSDVVDLLDGLADHAPILANRVFTVVRKLFNWLVERETLAVSPCTRLRPPSVERSRDRVLSDDELREVWAAAGTLGYPLGNIVRLLILTGQRRSEVTWWRWSQTDEKAAAWTMPRDGTKNARDHVVPLSAAVLEILESIPRLDREDFLFPGRAGARGAFNGFSRGKQRLDDAIAEARRAAAVAAGEDPDEAPVMPPWTLHDLRRTAATGMARLAVPPHVVEAVLNHVSGAVSGVAAVYNRFAYLDEKRSALEAWSRYVNALVENQPGNVVLLRRGA